MERRGRDRMLVRFITAYANDDCHLERCKLESRSGEVYSIHHYVIKFVSDLRQVGGFYRFPPPIVVPATM
jgi:hypothetical protein